MATIKPLGDGKYQINYTDPITKKRHRPTIHGRKKANDLKRRIEEQALFIKYNTPTLSSRTLRDAINEFLDVTKVTKKYRTFEKYREQLRHFYNFMEGTYPKDSTLSSLTTAHIERYKTYRLSLGRADATITAELTTIGTLILWAIRMGFLKENPARLVTKPGYKKHAPRIYSAEEWKKILRAAGARKLYYLWLYWTGSRLREPFVVQEKHIDTARKTFLYQNSKTGEEEIFPIATPLLKELRPKLTGNPDSFIFLEEMNHDKRNRNYLLREFQKLLERLGIPHGGIHDIKRSVLTHLGDAGVHPFVIQKIGHHSNIKTTMKYLREPNINKIKKAFRSLDS